eukprot:m.795 g.795  ORF g.795 m.795 type:complete len:508 (+) comp4890_c0_seq1:93-1616(+)
MHWLLTWIVAAAAIVVSPSTGDGNWTAWSGCDGATACSETRQWVDEGNTTGEPHHQSRECPIQCTYVGWSGWTKCACRGGSRSRTAATVYESPRGCLHSQCRTKAMQNETCSVERRPGPSIVDCVVSEWSDWSACDGGETLRRRERRVTQLPLCDVGVPCPERMEETEICRGTPSPFPSLQPTERSKKSGFPWWLYFVLALVSALLLTAMIVFLLMYRRHRCGAYWLKSKVPRVSVKPSPDTFDVNDRVSTLTVRGSRSPTSSSKRSSLHSCIKRSDSRRKKGVNFVVDMAGDGVVDGVSPSGLSDGDESEREDTVGGITNSQWNTRRNARFDSTNESSQLVWYFDNDDRSSVVHCNTEDREDADERLAQPLPLSNAYSNPAFDSSDSVFEGSGPEDLPEIKLRLDAEGKSDTEDPPEVATAAAELPLTDLSKEKRSDSSMPPADGESEPTSPTSLGGSGSAYRPKKRGHGIWECGEEVTPDGRKYTKIKATVLRLPSSQISPATIV